MSLKKRALSLLICSSLVIGISTSTGITAKAVATENKTITSVDVNKDGNKININIDTDKVKDDLNNLSDEAKKQFDELNDKGFFTRLFQWFQDFMESVINLFQDLLDMFK